jgi:hypothetical protein
MLEKEGGVLAIVGGDRDGIIADMEKGEKPYSRWRRGQLKHGKTGVRYVPDKNGGMIVAYQLKHANTLRARYAEANRKFLRDRAAKVLWTNALDILLGRPPSYHALPSPASFLAASGRDLARQLSKDTRARHASSPSN